MKPALLLIPTLCLVACAAPNRTVNTLSPTAVEQAASDESLPDANGIREPSRVHTYLVNDYIDPNNPHLRHRGHLVDAVEQDEKWNLHSTDTTEADLGPVTAANDPDAAPNPYNAEFETELSQQRDQSHQLADLVSRMTAQMGKLSDMAEKSADVISANAALRERLERLQSEIDTLKAPPPPIPPTAPKKPSWLESIWDLFRQVPQGKPVAEGKLSLHATPVLQAAGTIPEVSTTPPVARTDIPDSSPSTNSPPSPNPPPASTNSDTPPLPQP